MNFRNFIIKLLLLLLVVINLFYFNLIFFFINSVHAFYYAFYYITVHIWNFPQLTTNLLFLISPFVFTNMLYMNMIHDNMLASIDMTVIMLYYLSQNEFILLMSYLKTFAIYYFDLVFNVPFIFINILAFIINTDVTLYMYCTTVTAFENFLEFYIVFAIFFIYFDECATQILESHTLWWGFLKICFKEMYNNLYIQFSAYQLIFWEFILPINYLSWEDSVLVYYFTFVRDLTQYFIIKFILIIGFVVIIRSGVPRYRFDYLTKLGWLKFLGFTLGIFIFILIFYFFW